PSSVATLASHSGAPGEGAGFGVLGLAVPGVAVTSAGVGFSSRPTNWLSGTSWMAASAAFCQVTFVALIRSLRSVWSSLSEADAEGEAEVAEAEVAPGLVGAAAATSARSVPLLPQAVSSSADAPSAQTAARERTGGRRRRELILLP